MKFDEIYKPATNYVLAWHHYYCSYCDSYTTGHIVAFYPANTNGTYTSKVEEVKRMWLVCSNSDCNKASIYEDGSIYPPGKFGETVKHLTEDVAKAYDEARNCFGIGAYTACELLCRKILMYVACDKGAEEGKQFAHYIDFLEEKQLITSQMKPWIKKIKDNGNNSTHELKPREQKSAESTLSFTAHLLKIIYEFEATSKQFAEGK